MNNTKLPPKESPAVLNFAPTGMVPTKEMTPHVPITPEEIIQQVKIANDLGITMVHIHARNVKTGKPTWKKEVFAEIISGIRSFAPELVICVTLSGRDWSGIDKRTDVLNLNGELKPDMGSLTLSSLNFPNEASVNNPNTIKKLADVMKEEGIVPELECFSLGMMNYSKYMADKGILNPPYYYNLLHGNVSSTQADLLHIATMIKDIPSDSLWSLAGIGDSQLPMNSIGIISGGGVRVGIEDNIWLDQKRTKLATNEDLIKRVHSLAKLHGREIMKPAEFRDRLDLQSGNGSYGR